MILMCSVEAAVAFLMCVWGVKKRRVDREGEYKGDRRSFEQLKIK